MDFAVFYFIDVCYGTATYDNENWDTITLTKKQQKIDL